VECYKIKADRVRYFEGEVTYMNHQDHVNLLKRGVAEAGGIWADFGSGSGAFTLALADLLGSTGEIYSVDKDRYALKEQERAMRTYFPDSMVHYINADFTRGLTLPTLDGVVMANSLHFLRQKDAMLQLVRSYIKLDGRLLLVEYNADRGNTWVPYPLSYRTWEVLARKNGFAITQLLATVPSRFFGEIYSALSTT
jgi:ubiquinone/menaquinone biosynthesis C-methylase UbiE